MTEVLCYSTVCGELPKLIANNTPMCLANWSDYVEALNKSKEIEKKLEQSFTNEDKESIFKAYMDWVDNVSEDLPDKSSFSARELVEKVIGLCEEHVKGLNIN